MASYVFDEILAKGIRAGKIPARTAAAREWYRKTAQQTAVTPTRVIEGSGAGSVVRPKVGRLYLYEYDPKHKKTLPYYDRFPLVFPFSKTDHGFIGINLHYLSLPYRARLMDALYDLKNNSKYDETTRLKLSYGVLKGASKFKYFKPCIHEYLIHKVNSRFIEIAPAEWDIALWLPIERFYTNASRIEKRRVWKDSRSAF